MWEYHLEGPEITPERMNELGAGGWEAYAIDVHGRTRFKRPLARSSSLRPYTMSLTPGPPPAQYDRAVAFLDSDGFPVWVTATNPLPVT